MVKTTNRKTFARRFKEKQFFKLLDITRACPLSFEQRVMYSFLVKAAVQDQGYRPGMLAMDSGLEEGKTVPRCREALVTMGLARVASGVIYAREPEGETLGWFRYFESKQEESIWKSFGYVRVPLREPGCKLTARQVALLGLLYSFAKDRSDVKGLTITGMATMLGASRQTVHDAMTKLVAARLVEVYPSRTNPDRFAMILPNPTSVQLFWFRNTPEANNKADEDYPGFNPHCDDDERIEPHDREVSTEATYPRITKPVSDRSGSNEAYVEKYDEDYEMHDQDEERDAHYTFRKMLKLGFEERQAQTCYGLYQNIDYFGDMEAYTFDEWIDAAARAYDKRFPSCFWMLRTRLAKAMKSAERSAQKRATPKKAGSEHGDRIHEDDRRVDPGLHDGGISPPNPPPLEPIDLFTAKGYTEEEARARIDSAGTGGVPSLEKMIEHLSRSAGGYKDSLEYDIEGLVWRYMRKMKKKQEAAQA